MKKTAKAATNLRRGVLGVEVKRHSFRGNLPQNISCVSRAWNTPEPAVSQVPIRHNRSLRSLLFRLELDSRQNPVCNGYRRSWEMNDSFPRPIKTLNLCYFTARRMP